jgi:anaerobic magnesium-protoporphyrin IX monomethyl ester cyclase
LQQQKPKILAIYEDDFNFLSKMCLTRMRELAWQLAQAGRDAGAIVIAHGSDATDHAKRICKMGPTSFWWARPSRVWSSFAHRS